MGGVLSPRGPPRQALSPQEIGPEEGLGVTPAPGLCCPRGIKDTGVPASARPEEAAEEEAGQEKKRRDRC